MQKTVTIWNIETGEEKEMQDFHAAFVLRVNPAWTTSPPVEPVEKPEIEPEPVKKRGKKKWQ